MSIDADLLASPCAQAIWHGYARFEKTVEPELKNQRGRRVFAGF